jgi:prepilin-type N-terminal cleavage/methylation domain-containing protein
MWNNKGFTLIEVIVSVSIFAIVAMTTIGALIYANRVNQQAQAVKLALDNLNFAMDAMGYELRQRGVTYYCSVSGMDPNDPVPPSPPVGKDCPVSGGGGGEEGIKLIRTADEGSISWSFYQLAQDGGRGYLEFWETEFGDEAVRITSPDLDLTGVRFYVYNSEPEAGDAAVWPRVLISITGEAQVGRQTHQFAVETLVSQR